MQSRLFHAGPCCLQTRALPNTQLNGTHRGFSRGGGHRTFVERAQRPKHLLQDRSQVSTAAATQAMESVASPTADSEEPRVRIVAVVADGALSGIGNTEVTLEEVLAHMARRVSFNNPGFQLRVFTDSVLSVRTPHALVQYCRLPALH